MSLINTVLSQITPEELGITLMHEHVSIGIAGWYANDSVTPFNRQECLRKSLETMKELQGHGVKTLVDATTNDTGRDAILLREISEKSGVNIICTTGLHNEAIGCSSYFKYRAIGGDATTEIYELFVREIEQGIGSSGVKAGVIKVATSEYRITPYEEMVLKAAARAQKSTGVPIITHTEEGTMGPEQADLLISEGANPKRIMIGHAGGSADIKYHTSILTRGVYLAFDRMGAEIFQPDTLRVACIIGLISMGYIDKLMFSNDATIQWLGHSLPDRSLTHVFTDILPVLKTSGISNKQISSILVENPYQLFTGTGT